MIVVMRKPINELNCDIECRLKDFSINPDAMKIESLISYLRKNDLPDDIILKAVFLIDWRYTFVHGEQLFKNITWIKDESDIFDINYTKKYKMKHLLSSKRVFSIDQVFTNYVQVLEVADFIIKKYKKLKYNGFSNLYSRTHPFRTTQRGGIVNLIDYYKEYNKINEYGIYIDPLNTNSNKMKMFLEPILIILGIILFSFFLVWILVFFCESKSNIQEQKDKIHIEGEYKKNLQKEFQE